MSTEAQVVKRDRLKVLVVVLAIVAGVLSPFLGIVVAGLLAITQRMNRTVFVTLLGIAFFWLIFATLTASFGTGVTGVGSGS